MEKGIGEKMKNKTKQLLVLTFIDTVVPMVFLPTGIYYTIITSSFIPFVIGVSIFITCRVSYALKLKDRWCTL
jgi:hypothetical protein